jgi:release factor glutamine methyltransferase
MTKTNLQTWLHASQKKLQGVSDLSVVETYAIASFGLAQPKEWLLAHPENELPCHLIEMMDSLIDRLLKGEPLPYLLGKQSFFGLEFEVTPDVLIPRPETELLVEEAINWLHLHPHLRNMIDVGTGSGIIPITLADQFDDLIAHAVDISTDALDVANRNIQKYNLQERIHAYPNDLLAGISGTYDLITANLPYIPTSRLQSLAVSRYEPLDALDGGPDGFSLIRSLLDQAPKNLKPGGLILLEIDDSHSQLAPIEVTNFSPSAKITVINDLAQKPRLLKIQA